MDGPIWLLTDAAMDVHEAPGHPERPDRRIAAAAGVRDAAGERLVEAVCVPASDDEIAAVHDARLIALLEEADRRGGAWLDPDTYVVAGSWDAARLAAGATVQAARAVMAGDAGVAFAAVRPPGHHAGPARASGFCLLNSVAIAAAALRADGSARRIAIVDWDVHHGDGTQDIFDADPDLCYASTHQWPFYPGTGQIADRGVGKAAGTKLNRPLDPGSGDAAFVAAWVDELLPAIEALPAGGHPRLGRVRRASQRPVGPPLGHRGRLRGRCPGARRHLPSPRTARRGVDARGRIRPGSAAQVRRCDRVRPGRRIVIHARPRLYSACVR